MARCVCVPCMYAVCVAAPRTHPRAPRPRPQRASHSLLLPRHRRRHRLHCRLAPGLSPRPPAVAPPTPAPHNLPPPLPPPAPPPPAVVPSRPPPPPRQRGRGHVATHTPWSPTAAPATSRLVMLSRLSRPLPGGGGTAPAHAPAAYTGSRTAERVRMASHGMAHPHGAWHGATT